MKPPKRPPNVVARLQNGLPFWPQESQQSLSLQEAANRSGSSRRRVRLLIELGLVDRALKVGARASYSELHVRQIQAVERLLDEGRYKLTELAWLNNPDALLAVNLAEQLKPQQILLSLFLLEADHEMGEPARSRSAKSSPFQGRIRAAISSSLKEALLNERTLISEAQEALRVARKSDA